MALIAEFLPTKDIESSETATTTFLTTTLRSFFFSKASINAGRESEIDKKLKVISLEEVSNHDSFDDCWIIIYDRVYDITGFLHRHPGGDSNMLEYAGRDCTEAFRGHSNDAVQSLKEFELGILPPHERIYRFPGTIRISESKPE